MGVIVVAVAVVVHLNCFEYFLQLDMICSLIVNSWFILLSWV